MSSSATESVGCRGGGREAERAAVSNQRPVAEAGCEILWGREDISSWGLAQYVPQLLQSRSTVPQGRKQESLALTGMARDDPPASSTASGQCAVKWDRNLKPKLAIMRHCTSVTDRRRDGLASWHKHEMYILHLALIIHTSITAKLVKLK